MLNQLKSLCQKTMVWETTNFLYYLPPSVIVGVLLSVNDQVIERPATKTIPLVTPAKNTGARLAPEVVSKRLLFTLANEYRGISWSLELDLHYIHSSFRLKWFVTGSIINTVVFILYGTRKSTVNLTTNLWVKVSVRLRLLVQPSILLYTATFLGDTLEQKCYYALEPVDPHIDSYLWVYYFKVAPSLGSTQFDILRCREWNHSRTDQ